MKKGFSLAELMVALAIISVIAAILSPNLKNAMPDSNKLLFKSAYKTVETTVAALINDDTLYPTGSLTNAGDATAFCDNFAAKVNLIGAVGTGCDSANNNPTSSTTPSFKTTNGMRWYGFYDTFAAKKTIWVDVDGANKGTNTIGSDILRIYIYPTGKIEVTDTLESGYLQDS